MPETAFIYYEVNPVTHLGDIKAVAPARIEQLSQYESFEIEFERVVDILHGRKASTMYCIMCGEDGLPDMILREEFGTGEAFVMPYLVRLEKHREQAEITVVVNRTERCYTIQMDPATQTEYWNAKSKPSLAQLPEEIVFYVVSDANPHIIIDHFGVESELLVEDGSVDVKFMIDPPESIDLMTNKYFKTYRWKEIA